MPQGWKEDGRNHASAPPRVDEGFHQGIFHRHPGLGGLDSRTSDGDAGDKEFNPSVAGLPVTPS